jgi:F0F1-type ATP synthase epsilon subunit
MKTFKLAIRTPLRTAFSKEVSEFHIDTETGRMVVLPGHTDLTAAVLFSKVVIKFGDTIDKYFIKNGILNVDRHNNSVELLCLSADEASDVTLTSVQDYLDMISQKLDNHESLSDYQIIFLKKEHFALKKQLDTMNGK